MAPNKEERNGKGSAKEENHEDDRHKPDTHHASRNNMVIAATGPGDVGAGAGGGFWGMGMGGFSVGTGIFEEPTFQQQGLLPMGLMDVPVWMGEGSPVGDPQMHQRQFTANPTSAIDFHIPFNGGSFEGLGVDDGGGTSAGTSSSASTAITPNANETCVSPGQQGAQQQTPGTWENLGPQLWKWKPNAALARIRIGSGLSRARVIYPSQCPNCKVKEPAMGWRHDAEQPGGYVCEACHRYKKTHGTPRPLELEHAASLRRKKQPAPIVEGEPKRKRGRPKKTE